MDLIHVTVSVGGKLYSRTGGHSVNDHNTTKRGRDIITFTDKKAFRRNPNKLITLFKGYLVAIKAITF